MTAPGEKETFDKLRDIFLSDVDAPEDQEATKVHKSAALFGQIAVNEKVITSEQLKEALTQKRDQPEKKVGQILMDLGHIQLVDLITVLRAQRRVRPSPLGNIGPYFLLEELGRGGVGRVYHAVHEGLLKQVAIKILEPSREISEEMLKRFHREAMVAARMQHPNIVAVHDVGNIGEVHYIVMDYLEGKPLSVWLENDAHTLSDRLDLLQKVARTVDDAHRQGVLHRDLKPENVIVRKTGEPVLVDFGLARGKEDLKLTQSGVIMGTPLFMSPEQVQGDIDRVGVGSDIFSLGVMIYYATTGSYPFFSETPRKLYELIMNKEQTPPSQVKDGLPPDIDIICAKCLEKEPGARYESAGLLAADLQNCAIGDPILATRVATMIRFWRRMRRRPTILGSVGIILCLLTFGTIFFLVQDKEKDRLNYALQLNSSYGQLHPQISELMKEADSIRYLGASEKETDRIVEKVDQAVAGSGDQTGMGEGYRGWIRFLLRDPSFSGIILEAREMYPENPFLDLILARIQLRMYLEGANWPDEGFTPHSVQNPYTSLVPVETPEMRAFLSNAREHLGRARASDVWKNMPALKWGIDLSEGFEAYATGDMDLAIHHLSRLEARPDLALEGAFFLALAQARKGNPEEAMSIAKRLLARRPDLLPAKRQLACCHRFLGGEELVKNRNATPQLLAAKRIFDEISLDPKHDNRIAALNLMLAISERRRGNEPGTRQYLQQALASYEHLHEEYPDSVRYLVNLARTRVDLGELDQNIEAKLQSWSIARELLRKAAALDPSSTFLAFCRLDNEINCHFLSARLGRSTLTEWNRLRSELDQVEKGGYSRDQVLVLKSRLYYALGYQGRHDGNMSGAKKALQKSILYSSDALEISPGLVTVRQNILSASFLIAELDNLEISTVRSLILDVEILLKAGGQFSILRVHLAKWLGKMIDSFPEEDREEIGNMEIDAWNKVVTKDPDRGGFRLSLGDAQARQGKRIREKGKQLELHQSAIRQYQSVASDDPAYPAALRGLAERYIDLFTMGGAGELAADTCREKSLQFADKAVSVNPDSIASRLTRLRTLNSFMNPDLEGMKTDVNVGFRINPEWVVGHYWLARIHFLKWELEEALSELELYNGKIPGTVSGNLLLAHIRFRQKDFQSVVRQADLIFKSEPENLEAWMLKGYALVYSKENDEARKVLRLALPISRRQGRDDVANAIERLLKNLDR